MDALWSEMEKAGDIPLSIWFEFGSKTVHAIYSDSEEENKTFHVAYGNKGRLFTILSRDRCLDYKEKA